ncbi:hypothetical protein [Streptomyces sp. NPDC051016]|uniref:hypothetical protein n=1 Tax=Streptomyces sp. NPDC051016 TaxID=3365638 RepID=UPI0037BCA266
MGKRPDLPKEFRSEARTAFAYLTETEGFSEPEDDGLGLVFRRGDLAVRLWYFAGRESSMVTGLLSVDPDGTLGRRDVWLKDLYTGLGCGPAARAAADRRGDPGGLNDERGGPECPPGPPPFVPVVCQASNSTSERVDSLSRTSR